MQSQEIGIHQFMPDKIWKWKILEKKIGQHLYLHDYQEIRLSILQNYDVIKEGLTVLLEKEEAKENGDTIIKLPRLSKDEPNLALRPEGTISVLHHAAPTHVDGEVQRFYYFGAMFRRDAGQSPREFHQLGAELLGSDSIISVNEIISMSVKICQSLGLKDVSLKLNNFGCETCRPAFIADMESFLSKNKSDLCKNCFEKLNSNPFADTRCNEPACLKVLDDAPVMLNYLCEDCSSRFNSVKKIQANLAHQYVVNPKLYKNYAYYNDVVFDLVINSGGEERLIGGGGRYDNLSRKITGKNIPAVGFYIDVDTLFEIMDRRGLFIPQDKSFCVYIVSQSKELEMMVLQIAHEFHENNIKTVLSTNTRSMQEDELAARRANCDLMLIVREENVRDGKILIRNLSKDHQDYVSLNGILSSTLIARKALNKE